MVFEPSVFVLYVDNIAIASKFYQNLLPLPPEEASPTFHSFKLSKGMLLALKARHSVIPPTDKENGSGELAFTVTNSKRVDELFMEWQAQAINIIYPPTQLPFAYTFVALDRDGNRLRVAFLEKAS